MTFRIKPDLYERLQWANTIRPDLSMAEIVRMAVRVYERRVCYGEDPGAGDVVLNVEMVLPCTPIVARTALAWFLDEQQRKIESRKTKPLDLEQCETYIVEEVR